MHLNHLSIHYHVQRGLLHQSLRSGRQLNAALVTLGRYLLRHFESLTCCWLGKKRSADRTAVLPQSRASSLGTTLHPRARTFTTG